MKAADLPRYYNAVDILERNLTERSDKTALYSLEREMTFREVSNEVNQVGHALKRFGVRFGDVVGILVPDSAEWVTSFFGAIKIGAIALGMNTLLKPHEYDYILRDSRARVLIVHESLLPAVEPILDQPRELPHVVVIGYPARGEDVAFHPWISREPTDLEVETTHRDDFCSLNYSSGTTGEPKGVLHAHKDYPLIAQLSGVNLFGLQASDRTFSVAKLFFVYGIGGNLIFPWYVGASTILHPGSPRMVPGVLEAIDRFKPTILYSVPTAYVATMTLRSFATRYDLSSLRLCLSAGEALPASVWHDWKSKTGLEILDTIGCTESLHTFLANRPGDIRPGSSGKPFPGYDVKLLDDEGANVRQGEIGNLLVRGESVALSYLHQYEKSRQTFRGEWLFTNDKYYVDADGYYWYAGRSDDMLKVGGLWVSPQEIEATLMSHPAVLECAVVGQRDRVEMVKPKAFVCLNADYDPSDALIRDLLSHCAEHLAAHKCPRWIEFIDALPQTATGKTQRFKLRDEGI
ncbi:MAG: benzoate-CoA ligase family protein [Candidatus Tectomicrobia bacterium]|nr:benzoate-CoA ligase family protein [Candidatus Tectomicrobia bacterium]